jgi:hypothetical protein
MRSPNLVPSCCVRWLPVLLVLLTAWSAHAQRRPGGGPPPYQAQGLFTALPTGLENADAVFLAADTAMQSGRFVEAQRDFGTLYLLAPGYANGAPQMALQQTCTFVQNDCDALFERLHLLRDALYGVLGGPPPSWPPMQRQDFDTIVACYDAVLMQNWPVASTVAAGVAMQSPLPGFREWAGRCTQRAQGALQGLQMQAQMEEALRVWDQRYGCMEQNRLQMVDAYRNDDWDAFVTAWERYAPCAADIDGIVRQGVLAAHPVAGPETQLAGGRMADIDGIIRDNQDLFERSRGGREALAQDAGYQAHVMELDLLRQEIQRLRTDMQPLIQSLEALTGSARLPLEQRLNLLQLQLDGITGREAEVVAAMNTTRRSLGMPALPLP